MIQAGGSEFLDGRPFGAALEYTSSIARNRASVDSSSAETSLNFQSSDVGSESENMQVRTSIGDGFRISVSSTPSCSSQGSGPDDIESLGDVYVWGEVWCDTIDGSISSHPIKRDVLIPKPLESNVVLDVHQISCGVRHFALVNRQGEVFTWGEESGGRLGHGIEKDFSHPRLVEFLAVTNVDFVACGEYHTCAVSVSGDLYTWGDGAHNAGLLGHGTDVSHWIPKRVSGPLEGLQVLSVACGTWHSALVTSNGKLFTFGDGTFGVLGHGDRESVRHPREVQFLSGLKTIKVACGVWHTAAIVEVIGHGQAGVNVSSRKLFTWGDGDKNRLGHGNKEMYLVPTRVSALVDYNFHQLACGHYITVALTTSGHVFTMGSTAHGQLGNPMSDGKSPCLVQDRLVGEFVEEISCGAYHVAVLTSRSEVLTWGSGANGRLGHGDTEDRKTPTVVEGLKDRHVKNISCGSSYTASICIHKWVSGADQSVCSGCRQAFGFTRKRRNCYNCGLVHCHACSSKKALKAALAPTPGKPHRVCDSCYAKLKSSSAGNASYLNRKGTSPHRSMDSRERLDRGEARTSKTLLSPTTEPGKYLEVKSVKPGTKSDSYFTRLSQVPSLLPQKEIALYNSLGAFQYAFMPMMAPQPQPQPQSAPNSRPSSPLSRRPSPPRSVTPVFSRGMIDSLKKTNDLLSQEVSKFQNQIRSLRQQSEVQDVEIKKLKKDTQEATFLAAQESSKLIVAMEVIKSVAAQLKEMIEKLPPEMPNSENFKHMQAQLEAFLSKNLSDSHSSLPSESAYDEQYRSDTTSLVDEPISRQFHNMEDHLDAARVRDSSQNGERTPQESNQLSDIRETVHLQSNESGSRSPKSPNGEGQREVTEQFEPGVYVTLVLLQNGTKMFKRVRFR
ncbi:hypothetical protein U1Q18_030270 [Sarracenia purpurea var. burkii]